MKCGKSTYKTVSGAACRRLGMRTMTHASPAKAPRPSLRRGLNRKGAVAVAFAIASTALLGMAALATEGGLWYSARRNGQTAVDLAAYAGVAQLAWRGTGQAGRTAAITAARETAAANGFATEPSHPTHVHITLCRWNGSTCTRDDVSPNAVQVDVDQPQRMGLAQLISSNPPVMRARAIAAIEVQDRACILSLEGSLVMGGNSAVDAPECTASSNRPGPTSIQCGNSGDLDLLSLRAVGTTNPFCDDLGVPIREDQLPATDPYRHLLNGYGWPPNTSSWMPNFRTNGKPGTPSNDCQVTALGEPNSIASSSGTGVIYRPLPYNSTGPYTTPRVLCDLPNITDGSELELVPGTYFFSGKAGSLTVTGGRVTCPDCVNGRGVTLVFTGPNRSDVATATITGGFVNLNAPTTGPWYQGTNTYTRIDPVTGALVTADTFEGILIYRIDGTERPNDNNPDSTSDPNTMRINGNADSVNLNGAIYAPTSAVFLAGGSAVETNMTDCQSIVAGIVRTLGNASLALSLNGCAQYGTSISENRVIRLVQ